MKIKEIPIKKEWYRCPYCGTKLFVYDNTAKASGIFMKCRTCKNEIEVKIK